MAGAVAKRLPFGPSKYAAFHLMLSRWLRHYGKAERYSYITLGGTELRDIENLHFIDRGLVSSATSYELDRERHILATERAEQLRRGGVEVLTVNDDIFSCDRATDDPHLFFFDFTRICAWSVYSDQFADLFQRAVIKEGDTVLVTSHLGHNPGWERVFESFVGEFSLLDAADTNSRRSWYRRAHPSFTLFKALRRAGLADQLCLRCLGSIEYRDSSPMGLYGYVVMTGRTVFAQFVKDAEAPYFRIGRGYLMEESADSVSAHN